MRGTVRRVVACMVALTALTAVPAQAEAAVQISEGSLQPPFDPSVSDYTVRCDSPVVMHVDASSGSQVSMDGDPFASGAFDKPVPLSENQGFSWVVREGGQSTTFHARCLPADFPSYTVERPGQPQAQWYVVAPNLVRDQTNRPRVSFVVLFDNHGVPVWWTSSFGLDAKLLPNGRLAWASSVYEEHEFDTNDVVHAWQTVGVPTDQHDLQLLPNGDVLMVAYPERTGVDVGQFKPGQTSADVVDAEIQEIAPDGHLVWDWNSKDHIALRETDPKWWPHLDEPYDLVHINSVEDDGDGIIFSGRHLDAIYRIDKATGDVDWKIGGDQTRIPQSLTVTNDPLASHPFGGQHYARRLADGTVTVHDNGTDVSRAPRAVRYEIDTAARTAKLVESVSDAQVSSSSCCGSARKLSVPGGDWVISWGANSIVEEMTPTSQRVFALRFGNNRFSYRADPVLPGRVGAGTLRDGMDRLNPRPPAMVEVIVDGPVRAGVPFTVTTRVLDAGRNVVSSYGGHGTWSDTSGTLSPAAPADFASGVSTTNATVPATVAEDRITVTTGGLTGQSPPFAVAEPAGPSSEPRTTAPVAGGAEAAIPVTGPATRLLAVDVARRDRRIRVGRDGRFAFVLGAQDVDATGRIRFTASVSRRALAEAGRRVAVRSKTIVSTAGRPTIVRVRLPARHRRMLAAARRLRTTAAITVRDAAGTVARRTYRFSLLAPRVH